MLILSRKIGQQIYLDSGVVITLVEIGGSAVRIGVEAPKGVRVMREELLTDEERAEIEKKAKGN